uniref:Uncharacterized protein n=1 Tax=Arundo donax TaxID=35708 RepID=A0A0A9EGJ4_ARUDO
MRSTPFWQLVTGQWRRIPRTTAPASSGSLCTNWSTQ